MEPNEEIIHRLTQLRGKKKFTDAAWNKRGLNPSEADKVNEMIRLTDLCLDELLTELRAIATKRQIEKTLTKGLKRFKTSDYDTEEREFIGDEFSQIGSILRLNIADDLNDWLYGRILGTIIRLTKKNEVIIDSKSFECTKCKFTLSVKVTSTEHGAPNYWVIGQCYLCDEYNLLSIGENTGGLKFENFTSTEILNGRENSEEQAKTRLEQIKYFRGRN